MEGEVPRGIPWIFPFVGHGDDVVVVEMAPVRVATGCACLGRTYDIAVEPARDVVMIELLAPQDPGECLPHHCRLFLARAVGGKRCIVLVSFAAPGDVNL